MNTQFKLLFYPIKIGPTVIKNRIVSLPHGTSLASGGNSTEREALYLAEKAKGGTGLIVHGALTMDASSWDETSWTMGRFVSVRRDECIPGLKKVADHVHEYGAKIIGQLVHNGRQRTTGFPRASIDVSPFAEPIRREAPCEIEVEDIQSLVKDYGTSAKRVLLAGYDGVELHACNGYLLSGFLNPNRNKRTDEYGGSLENRSRFIFESLQSIRDTIGYNCIVGIRMNGDDFEEGGFGLPEAVQLARKLEESRLVDYISVSQGTYANYHAIIPPLYVPNGAFVYLSAEIKRAVNLPVICAGRINDPIQAERVLAEGQADLVGVARALIADPEWPRKASEGKLDDIRPCIACNQACREAWEGIACTVNPVIGREKQFADIQSAKQKKNVVVVGGGPAGLEAARVARLRGHEVTLYEKREALGGQVALLARDPIRQELGGLVRWLSGQVEKLGVKVVLKTEFTPETVSAVKPDVVVVATGSIPLVPEIPGRDGQNIFTSWDVLEGNERIGKNVVVVGEFEGHQPPLMIAENLADKGKKVIVISALLMPGIDIGFETAVPQPLYTRLFQKKVRFIPFVELKEIRGNILFIANRYTHERETIEDIDSVVFAIGGRPDNQLFRSLKGKVKELFRVGDCVAPRRIPLAVYDGSRVGRQI